MTKISCPLSGGSRIVLLEKIKTSDLVKMYRKSLSYDIISEYGDVKELYFHHCLDCDLKFFYPMITGSEAYYERMQKLDGYYMDSKHEYGYARQFIKDSDTVLEIGCGKGAFAKKVSPKEYVALEFSQNAIRMAQAQGIDARKESIQSHTVNNLGKYDVVCAFQVLEHVADVQSFIESSIVCLKPGGLLIYSVPSSDSFVSMLRNARMNLPPHHLTWWSDKCLEYISERFGVSMVHLEHEILADHEKIYYTHAVILAGLENILGIKPSLINRSLKYKIINKLSSMGAKILKKGLVDYRVLPRGHTVTVVYRK